MCSYGILTILAVFQPGGAHHQGPRQAHEDPGEGDENFYNKCSKNYENYGVGGFEVQTYVMRRCKFMSGRQKDAGMAQGEPP